MSVKVTHLDEGSWPIETGQEPLQIQGIRCRGSWLSLNHQDPAVFTGQGLSAQPPSATGGERQRGKAVGLYVSVKFRPLSDRSLTFRQGQIISWRHQVCLRS